MLQSYAKHAVGNKKASANLDSAKRESNDNSATPFGLGLLGGGITILKFK